MMIKSTSLRLRLVFLISGAFFLAAVEGFHARGLSRPWENSIKKRITTLPHKKIISALIQCYANDKIESTSKNDATTNGAEESDAPELEDEEAESFALQDPEIPGSSSHELTSGTATVVMTSTGVRALTPQQNSEEKNVSEKATVRSCLPDLIAMTRPSNLPGVVLFHMLGTYLAVKNSSTSVGFWSLFVSPSMMVTLVALLLTSSTSMLVNDYYDFKSGLDSAKVFQPLNTPSRLPLVVAKRFLSYLYAAALLCVSMVPGVPARMAVVMGLMLTFWYTQHLKPKTWLKNGVCASLIALSPLTSGVAAMSVLGTAATGAGLGPLLRVVAMLFAGILGREITMDINDVQDDSQHGVRTVPVTYGRKFASTIGLLCSFGMVALALAGPLWETLTAPAFGGGSLWRSPLTRRWVLAGLGSLAQLRRSLQVFRSEGQNREIVKKAIEEGLLTVVLLLASYV